MSDISSTQPDPSMIGGIPKAPFVRLPDPVAIFTRRAARFATLAATSELSPYLGFLASIAEAQAAAVPSLPPPELPDAAIVARAGQFAMPPLDRGAFKPDATLRATCACLLEAFAAISKPEAAEVALGRVHSADRPALDAMIASILSDSIPFETVAEHVYVAATLQVHFARLAARLDSAALVPVGVGACPVCGGPPVASLIVGWYGAEGTRYASCALCSTLWNEVRVKCLACGSTKGIGYQEVDGGTGTIKAETCDECGSYVKVFYQHKDVALDPVADDVGSLGLDVLLRADVYRRAGVNPYLIGY
ncbi:MAG: formate dehydrogenase accessory protein FdhE [Rhodospirillales bacterium]|nr:formate dehydrogenase accessory protein FdhE [Rhodospirillales bacterium]